LAVLLWATLVEPARLVVHEHSVGLVGWPAGRTLRLAVLADIHTGAPHMGPARVRAILERVRTLRPDALVLLGDYVIHGVVGGRFVAPEETAALLGAWHPPLGTFAVLGNHDGWFDGPRVRRALGAHGVRVLVDEALRCPWGAGGFWLMGLDDLWTGHPDPARVLASIPAGEPVIALTHSPDVFPGLPERVGLTLAGHTHGGQVRLPWWGPPVVPSAYGARYAAGLYREGARQLFVTSGLGTSILPVRLGVPPEIALVNVGAAP
jgi:hypothetical protein